MIIDCKRVLKNRNGQTLKIDEKTDATIGNVLSLLIDSVPQNKEIKLPWGNRKCNDIASRLYDDKTVELDSEDFKQLSEYADQATPFNNSHLLLGQIVQYLDEMALKAKVKK